MADRKQDELDRMLDAALAKYAAVEPRTGLEDRILANLRAERTRVPDRAWWRWSVAGALAAVVVVALALAWRSGKPSASGRGESFFRPRRTSQGNPQHPSLHWRSEALRGNQARPHESVAQKRREPRIVFDPKSSQTIPSSISFLVPAAERAGAGVSKICPASFRTRRR